MSKESSKTLQQIANDLPPIITLQDLFENCSSDEIERVLDKFNNIPEEYVVLYSELIKAMEEAEDVVGDTIKNLLESDRKDGEQ